MDSHDVIVMRRRSAEMSGQRCRYGNGNKAVGQGRRLRMNMSCFRIEALLSSVDKEATSSQPVAMQKHVLFAE